MFMDESNNFINSNFRNESLESLENKVPNFKIILL